MFYNDDQVQVKSSLIYMDYEGRSDGRSLKSILAHVAPLKLVRVFLEETMQNFYMSTLSSLWAINVNVAHVF